MSKPMDDRAANDGRRLVAANGVEICTEAFGDPVDPPVLLVIGATASMLWWEDAFCRQLAAGERYVIRMDNRDTGESVTYPVGARGGGTRTSAALTGSSSLAR